MLSFLLAATLAVAEFDHSRVRLIDGGEHPEGGRLVGVEMRLADGWKTYWRHPGDSGIPPRFEWKGSSNLKAVDVEFPAPERLRDEYGESIGYERRVAFPIRVERRDPNAAADLRLELSYGACSDVCVPAQATLSLRLDGEVIDEERDELRRALSLVPRRDDGAIAAEAFLVGDEDSPRLRIAALEVDRDAPLDAFIEGPSAFGFAAPRRFPDASNPDGEILEFEVYALESPSRLIGETLSVTLVQGDRRLVAAVRAAYPSPKESPS